MTATSEETELVTLTVDGTEITVPPGTLVIRAAEAAGVEIPRFCDHPLLEPAGACRQCLVEVTGQAKPVTACTAAVTPGMAVRTHLTSPMAERAQRGVMELLLINHPLDCPVCDKGGECPLQNQAMTNGGTRSRFAGPKRTFPKPVAISSLVLLDRERCVQCARCTRFAEQVAGDPLIALMERGSEQQIGVGESTTFDSYFSGNAVQICPVGALTASSYRFRSRPFDLVSTRGVCEHCAAGCAIRTDSRGGEVVRRNAGDDPAVNEEWSCDKGRWAFQYATAADRLTAPLVRDRWTGRLESVPWPDALAAAAAGLVAARGNAGVLTGGRLSLEDAYGYAKFARIVLGTNDVDFRARPLSVEETGFLTTMVAPGDGPAYADLERAPVVLLAGLEPEEEAPIVFLRLRKAVRAGLRVLSVAPFASRGLEKLEGTLLRVVPGEEAGALASDEARQALSLPGTVILVGERLAGSAGALTAVAHLAEESGAALGWVPRRAGDRGALEAGAFPTLLPGGRPVADAGARAEVAGAWGVRSLPAEPGRDTESILAAGAGGDLGALLVAGVEPADLRDPRTALQALERTPFVVSLETRAGAVTERADVVLPVAVPSEKAGTFVNWENRHRAFEAAVRDVGRWPDHRVLTAIAARAGADLGTVDGARQELARLGSWSGARPRFEPVSPVHVAPREGEAVLATWRMLLDNGRLQDGEPNLAAAARRPVARLSASTAAEIGVADGDGLTVSTATGSITLPLAVADLPERVVWLPQNSKGCTVLETLGAPSGSLVRIAPNAVRDPLMPYRAVRDPLTAPRLEGEAR
ncbi:NADH-quinone oxidoreductase subunit G [Amycolatopsis alkalitolerans]|uniref:NADH-quinone oxidoreductase n=1 Tax=Amycolatopsis alkalitolerans TaxID=2547244 RepID=A0A5C4M1M8_9PSEU|nr:NADH-quinone oxidoreductase subunit G [Amycolatopsis alkalitolerans]TNC25799.1 NADH-quinone oxidoreductase subunit G [Amycolatopsis alkalitolerans]